MPFISKLGKQVNTANTNYLEAAAADMVLARITCGLLYFYNVTKEIAGVRGTIGSTFVKDERATEAYLNLIKTILSSFYEGLKIFQRFDAMKAGIYVNLKTLPYAQPEFQPRSLDIVKDLFELAANQFFMERLRIKEEWEALVSVVRRCYNQLLMIEGRIMQKADDIDDRMINFVKVMKEAMLLHGYWALIKLIEHEIRYETWTRKPFKELSRDLISLAEALSSQIERYWIVQTLFDKECALFINAYIENAYKPTRDKVLEIYSSFHERTERRRPDDIFLEWTKELDYFGEMVKYDKP
eukprot:TRINITY_DN2212_c0_g2_i12.p1 TRINITY_DN2212_c0_g2~~TRINITY_DN2212_c0_g2_i12.p1  ORF type:complete len:298 (+),score=66.01 TRINITY_DN2212_c0_g2_i12:385-1278(+)